MPVSHESFPLACGKSSGARFNATERTLEYFARRSSLRAFIENVDPERAIAASLRHCRMILFRLAAATPNTVDLSHILSRRCLRSTSMLLPSTCTAMASISSCTGSDRRNRTAWYMSPADRACSRKGKE